MKNTLLTIASGFLLLISQSCSTNIDPEVVWYPVNLMIFVQNQYGEDLLDPQHPYNVLEATSFNWQAKDYLPVQEMPKEGEYKFSHLNTSIFEKDDIGALPREGYFLNFGQIDGSLDMDAIMYLTLPDSPIHEIRYHCGNHVAKTQSCDRYWMLDGKETANPFVITVETPEK